MKKTKYINKYDYINYYTKPDYLWFLSNNEINALLETAQKTLKIEKINIDEDDDEDINDFNNDDNEFDSYEYFKELKEEMGDIDENNAKILEGKIIDEKTKQFIIENYNDGQFIIIDFDDKKYTNTNNEQKNQLTLELIKNNKKIIMFQPTFIDDNKITRPDCLIVDNEYCHLIETKGTSTCKIIHFLDLFFQKQVLEKQSIFKHYDFKYSLCLVKYEKLNKKEISFVITDYINYQKNLSFTKFDPSKETFQDYMLYKANKKIGIDLDKNSYEDYSLRIDDVVNNNLSSLINKSENAKFIISKNSAKQAIEKINLVFNEFDFVVEKLGEALKKAQMEWNKSNFKEIITKTINNIFPNKRDKNSFKDLDILPILKQIYVAKNLDHFLFSGNVTCQTENDYKQLIENLETTNFTYLNPIFKQPKNNPEFYINLFNKTQKNIIVNEKSLNDFLTRIKPIQVYFDFETINTAIRAVDNSYPFTQVVTQCSILKIGKLESDCINLIIDPLTIDTKWYKTIVDNLYVGDEDKYNASYIVYNKTFEKKRLEEISVYLDNEYKRKIESIINNLVDLADLFRLSTKNITPIFLKDLHGFYSIKKVLPLIEKFYKQAFEKAKCIDYKTLEIGNGKICQDQTTIRFFEKLSDDQWLLLSKKLQQYCENDVRAMYAIYLYAQNLLL